MYQLICTSFKESPTAGLLLREEWIEEVKDDKRLLELIEKWQLPNDFKYPSKGSISEVLKGRMDVPSVFIHVRIVRF